MNVIYFLGKPNQVHALKNINLEIYPGEFIIFFGPSGCGKSTLLYSIAGLERNTHGKIYIDGKNIAQLKNRELEKYHQKKIGMIFQAYYLIGSLSVINNVVLPQIAIGVKKSDRIRNALELLGHFGVKNQANKMPNELSGGQQQRVAICRSLINDPDVLLADEPVGNLDSKSSDDVMNLLKELNDKSQKTVILVTHNPTHLSMAHRVFHIKDGNVLKADVNKAINEQIAAQKEKELSQVPKELEMLARTYSGLSSESLPTLLIPFKAKQIVAEVMSGISTDEIKRIETRVERLLLLNINKANLSAEYLIHEFSDFLDIDEEKGGMGFNRRKALRIAEGIIGLISEIKAIQDQERKISENGAAAAMDKDYEVAQIRHFLLENSKTGLKSLASLENMNQAIRARLDNAIDRIGLQQALDLPAEKGGVGLNRTIAKKIAKQMELLMLGKLK